MRITDMTTEETTDIVLDGQRFTNLTGMPYELAVLNAQQSRLYTGGKPREGKVSTTSIIGALKPLIYSILNPDVETIQDVSKLTASSRGTAMHTALEQSLKVLDAGYIVEHRIDREVNGWKVSGELDLLTPNKQIKDLKTTSTYITDKLKADIDLLEPGMTPEEMLQKTPTYGKFVMQLSIYRYLLDDPEVKSFGSILFMLNSAGFNGDALNSETTLPLFPTEAVGEFLFNRIQSIKDHIANGTVPDCTPQERGYKEGEWKLTRYSVNTTKWATVRGSKFNNEAEFRSFVTFKGKVGDKEVILPPSYFVCDNWCKHGQNGVCTQHTG